MEGVMLGKKYKKQKFLEDKENIMLFISRENKKHLNLARNAGKK
jgi:hypothetical protein